MVPRPLAARWLSATQPRPCLRPRVSAYTGEPKTENPLPTFILYPRAKPTLMSNPAEKQTEPGLPTSSAMAWYQVTLSAIGDAVLTTDPEGRVTYLNLAAESL